MWEKELKIVEGLGKLYPEFEDRYVGTIIYSMHKWDNWDKSRWVYCLCVYHLNQRIPSLEKFIEKHCGSAWFYYYNYFKIEN